MKRALSTYHVNASNQRRFEYSHHHIYERMSDFQIPAVFLRHPRKTKKKKVSNHARCVRNLPISWGFEFAACRRVVLLPKQKAKKEKKNIIFIPISTQDAR